VTHPIVEFLSECHRSIGLVIDRYGDMKPHEGTPSNPAIRISASFFSEVCVPAAVIVRAIGLLRDQPLRRIIVMVSPSYRVVQ
jgi:hypothetical protein